jgi:hypothetical protein
MLLGKPAALCAARFARPPLSISVFFLTALAAGRCQATIISVTATANPFLADPANVPMSDPALDGTAPAAVNLSPFSSVESLSIIALGRASEGVLAALADSADGKQLISGPSIGAISGFHNLPLCSLVGVFVGPALGPAPPPAAQPLGAQVISPQLGQIFFIGDGLTGSGSGVPQRFVIPAGATTLYLANLDSSTWSDDQGTYQVMITRGLAPIPEPGTLRLAALGALLIGYQLRRRRQAS